MTAPNFNQGKVYIVGAGVGGIDYLTVRAKNLLECAEVVVYDALVDESLLDLVRLDCDRQYVGKRGGQPSITQPEINALLVEKCQQGKQVVRLKSGDPFIFGRAVAEIAALHEAKCEFELVPGISSAIAAPLFAGIPLTDKEISPCFAVLTAHELDILPWQALAAMPTIVMLMGTAGLVGTDAPLLEKLKSIKPAKTAIAIIQWCGSAKQQIWTGTLDDIHLKLPNRSLSPAAIVVGEVVKFGEWMDWFRPAQMENAKLPLTGKTVMITRSASQSNQFADLLIAEGAKVLEMPALEIQPPSSWQQLDLAIAKLETYDWLVLTSANGVESFFARLREAKKDSRALHQLKIAVVGRKTAAVLAKYGIKPDLIPPDYVADELIAVFPPVEGLQILFPRVETGGREVLIEQLSQKGANVDAVPAYESGIPQQIDLTALAAIKSQQIDAITFASSKTVKYFCQMLNDATGSDLWREWISNAKIASIGPQTSATCVELLGRVDIEANEYTLEGLTTAIANYFIQFD